MRYVWGLTPSPSEPGEFYLPPVPQNPPVTCSGIYPTAVVTDRYVSDNGTTEVDHQQFAYTTQWNGASWTDKTTTVTTTDLGTGASRQTLYDYQRRSAPHPAGSDGLVASLMPVAASVKVVSGSTTLRTMAEN